GGLDHPEGLAFDRRGSLWAGGEAGQIYRIDAQGDAHVVANLGHFCAGLAFSPEDELFVCVATLGIVHVRRDGTHAVFADHAGTHQIVYANFPVFDRRGNLYATDSGNWTKRNGYILRFTPEGKGEILGGPYGYANGLALGADGRSLFLVESDTDRIYRFELREDGSLGRRRLFARNVGRLPDGLALDGRGHLYAACYASDEIYRLDLSGRKRLLAFDRQAIRLGGPTNMAFGGQDFDELFVANLARQAITRVRVRRPGQPLANQRRT
ncbi:MAG: SMP-30/gluconolactonase/LRE family protein, partial [Acidobacteria bacterium]|nr:SMP-30/gluconolactonase/LRE family protein [Acidobacteriota bacterium]